MSDMKTCFHELMTSHGIPNERMSDMKTCFHELMNEWSGMSEEHKMCGILCDELMERILSLN